MALIDGKILVCDVCGSRKAYDESKPLPKRCWWRRCRSLRWNSGGQDRRRWPRVPPATPPTANSPQQTAVSKKAGGKIQTAGNRDEGVGNSR